MLDIVKRLFLPTIIIFGLLLGIMLRHILQLREVNRAFLNGELLNCHGLIVNNVDWRLVGDHLINNNIAGYLELGSCKINK